MICGGVYPTTSPEKFIPFFDSVFKGEAENTIRKFCGDFIHRNASTIYEVPLLYRKYDFDVEILKYFNLPYEKDVDLDKWINFVDAIKNLCIILYISL